jgi:mono/diheme cytochrome c family protein
MGMKQRLTILLLGLTVWGTPLAQQKPQAPGFPDAPGKETLLGRCFQCHGPGMWLDHRQDRKGWEGVLYRMVGRGALWTEEEIKTMADYLAAVYGRKPK